MPRKQKSGLGHLYRTFEYVDAHGDMAFIEVRITFNYTPGREAKTYGDPENCYPAEPAEREYITAERETADGKWVPIGDGEWLNEWCIAAFERADDGDLIAVLPEDDDRDDENEARAEVEEARLAAIAEDEAAFLAGLADEEGE